MQRQSLTSASTVVHVYGQGGALSCFPLSIRHVKKIIKIILWQMEILRKGLLVPKFPQDVSKKCGVCRVET